MVYFPEKDFGILVYFPEKHFGILVYTVPLKCKTLIMSQRKSFLSALLICSAALFGTGFRAPYFDPLSVKDGLSQNTVFSICQDSLGRMWMGTMDGLSRYDNKIKKFANNEDLS